MKNSQITQENFEGLLLWLSTDAKIAGEEYERIRQSLIRFFRFRGCDDPEDLADETMDRVARKLHAFTFDRNVKTITYFYSFASKIYLEELASRKKRWSSLDAESNVTETRYQIAEDDEERKFGCLDECLLKRPTADRTLIIEYYSAEKTEKLDIRKKMATELKMTAAALHTRMHRIRMSLRQCLEDCLCQSGL